jgi:hypothetical protein
VEWRERRRGKKEALKIGKFEMQVALEMPAGKSDQTVSSRVDEYETRITMEMLMMKMFFFAREYVFGMRFCNI